MAIKDIVQSADWKTEKHVPVIDAPAKAKKGEMTKVAVCVGKEIAHPNTTEHHISWIEVVFLPKGEKFAYQITRCEFSSHGGSAQGPNTSTVYTHPEVTAVMKTDKSGTLTALSYCNIHGLWESSKEIVAE